MTESHMLSLEECSAILGVPIGASKAEIAAARRRLARELHPDAGGAHSDMALVNEAFRVLVSTRGRHRDAGRDASDDSPSASGHRGHDARGTGRKHSRFRDAPSFVVDALPVEAFDILLAAAAILGEVVDEDPPCLLEVLIRDPGPVWCRFEMSPDAGSTTVSLSCEVEVGYRVYSPEEIRDLWISTINSMSKIG